MKIDAGQAGAVSERFKLDADHAVADSNVGQAVAALNASSPMLVTLSEIVTLARPSQS